MKNKTFILGLIGGISIAVTTISFASVKSNYLLKGKADYEYAVEMSSSKNTLVSSDSLVSGAGNVASNTQGEVSLGYTNIKKSSEGWVEIANGEIHNITAINDMLSLEVNLKSGSLTVLFGSVVSDAIVYSSSQEVIASGNVNVPEGISHFKIIAEEAVIGSLSINYSCTSGVVTSSETPNLKGDGSVNYPYEIGTLAEWNAFSKISQSDALTGKNIVLTNDISGITNKIGTYTTGFAGIFDGKGKTLTVDWNYDSGSANQGLVGHLLTGGVVKNTTIAGTIVSEKTNDAQIGSLVGVLSGGTVDNCISTADITLAGYSNGGIVGKSDTAGSTISNCTFNGTITSSASNSGGHITTGGILGISTAKTYLTKCTNNADFSFLGIQVGGLVGKGTSVVLDQCVNNGDISTSSTVNDTSKTGIGGLAGYLESATVTSCKNYGDISSKGSMVGGMAGKTYISTLTDCENNGKITGKVYIGGLSGRTMGSSATALTTFKNCVNLGTVETLTGTADQSAGGMTGYAKWCKFDGCTNGSKDNATLGYIHNLGTNTATENHGAGGMAGFCESTSTYLNCVNYGKIEGTTSEIGGISGKSVTDTFDGCTNYGDVIGKKFVAGITGRAVSNCTIGDCTNHGSINIPTDLASSCYGQIVGDTGQAYTDNGNNTGDGAIVNF